MRRRIQKANGWKLVIAAFATGCLIVAVFWLRSWQTSSSDARLCRKVDRLDSAFYASISHSQPPKPGEYGYSYWLAHHRSEPNGAPGGKPPQALLRLLREAACDPANLPSNGGKP